MPKESVYDASDRWTNVNNETIHGKAKAEHMAHVENEWRDSIKEVGRLAATVAESDSPMPEYAANEVAMVGKYQAEQHGPRAVEQAGQDYDNFHHPILPPPYPEASISNPGERQSQ